MATENVQGTREVDVDFKDGDLYSVYVPEADHQPWHVMISMEEDAKYSYWAIMQLLKAKEGDIEFQWAVFMKTGRCGSSGLRHFSKKFTDGKAAIKTFYDWFEEKTGNEWKGDCAATLVSFKKEAGKYSMLTSDEECTLLRNKSQKERPRPKVGVSDVPVDIYFKDRDQYQVYVTADGELWMAVMSIKAGAKHTQFAIIQVLIAKTDVKVDFDFVVYMRQGKIGGSAQRYAKRYTVEAAALATFSQWFKEKTGNMWYGSFKDTLEEFEPQFSKFKLLSKEQWSEVVEFEEQKKKNLVESSVKVDPIYRDGDSYRVYNTEDAELWAAVLSRKDDNIVKAFVILQLLVKKPSVEVDFDYVVFRRIGERGESGQWTAKKFTNELDALRTFKISYAEETGNEWRGSFDESLLDFKPVPDKFVIVPQKAWEESTAEMNFLIEPSPDVTKSTLEAQTLRTKSTLETQTLRTLETLRSAVHMKEKNLESKKMLCPDELHDFQIPIPEKSILEVDGDLSLDKKTDSSPLPRKPSRINEDGLNQTTPQKQLPKKQRYKDQEPQEDSKYTEDAVAEKQKSPAADRHNEDEAVTDEVDSGFVLRDKYTSVILSVNLLQESTTFKAKFYCIQLLEGKADVSKEEKYCFYVRGGKVGSAGGTNFKLIGSREQGKKAFSKKFLEKTNNKWCDDYASTLKAFNFVEGGFDMVKDLPQA